MNVRLLRGRPHDVSALRATWPDLRSGARDAVAGLDADGLWHAVLVEPVAGPPSAQGFEDLSWFSSDDVGSVLAGGPVPGVGFVQVMTARVSDRAAWAAADAEAIPRFAVARPDFLGALRIWRGDHLTVVDSYRSEPEARAGEARGHTPEDEAIYQRWFSYLSDVAWHDLIPPW